MVRNAALLALVSLAASEQVTMFPFIGPQNMKTKHELDDDAGFHKFQHYCYNFIYAVVGKGDAKALQNLPSLVGPLCRASEADCKLYTESLRAAVEQKQLQLKLSRVSRPYADWCEEVYNHQHPTATHTTTEMPLHHHSSHGLFRHQAPEKPAAGQPRTTAAAKAGKAPGAPAAGARPPLQLKKSAAAPTTAKPQSQAALRPLVKRAARAVDAELARRQDRAMATATTTVEPSQAPAQAVKSLLDSKEMTRKEIQDMEKDVGNFDHHFVADMTGHAIASAAPLGMDKAQQLGGAEVAFDKAFAAVNKMDSQEHKHHHRHHSSR